MILLIDNYDSFSYNLYQMLGVLEPDIKVVRNDGFTLADIDAWKPTHIIISPGPGRPRDAGLCEDVIREFSGKIPILGVCLGHQAICEVFGATIDYAKELMHGKPSEIRADVTSPLFRGLTETFFGARYHSLAALRETLPETLAVTAAADGEIMAVEHKTHPTYGVQFHPESVLTPRGGEILKNFLEVRL